MDGLLTDHGISLAHLGEHATPLVASGPNSLHGRRDHDFLGHGMAFLATCGMPLSPALSLSETLGMDTGCPPSRCGSWHVPPLWLLAHSYHRRDKTGAMLSGRRYPACVSQTPIWESGEGAEKMAILRILTEAALQTNPDLILWPESAYPGNQSLEPTFELLEKHGSGCVLNTTDVDVLPEVPAGPAYYNAAFLVGPDGQLAGRYRKRHLVMFGEACSMGGHMALAQEPVSIQSSYRAGQTPITMEMQEPKVFLYPLICFEDVMPALSLDAVKRPSPLLVNLTNDGWFNKVPGSNTPTWPRAALKRGLAMVGVATTVSVAGSTLWGKFRGLPYLPKLPPTNEAFRHSRSPLAGRHPLIILQRGPPFSLGVPGDDHVLGHSSKVETKQTDGLGLISNHPGVSIDGRFALKNQVKVSAGEEEQSRPFQKGVMMTV